MGFWSTLGKAIQGKPLFDEQGQRPGGDGHDIGDSGEEHGGAAHSAHYDDKGHKITPEVHIERIKCVPNGANLDLYGYVENHSPWPLLLDKVLFLGRRYETDTDVHAHQTREVLLYRGPRPVHGSNVNLELQYRDETGDYFSAMFYAEFHHQPDGLIIRELKPQRQIKDI